MFRGFGNTKWCRQCHLLCAKPVRLATHTIMKKLSCSSRRPAVTCEHCWMGISIKKDTELPKTKTRRYWVPAWGDGSPQPGARYVEEVIHNCPCAACDKIILPPDGPMKGSTVVVCSQECANKYRRNCTCGQGDKDSTSVADLRPRS